MKGTHLTRGPKSLLGIPTKNIALSELSAIRNRAVEIGFVLLWVGYSTSYRLNALRDRATLEVIDHAWPGMTDRADLGTIIAGTIIAGPGNPDLIVHPL